MRVTAGAIERTFQSEWIRSIHDVEHDFPGLGTFTGDEMVDHLEGMIGQRDCSSTDASYAERDLAHHRLIELAQQGHHASMNVLLVAFRPLARSVAHRLAPTAFQGMPMEQAVDAATSALWETIMTYPLSRDRHVAGNLRGELLKRVSREFGAPRNREVPAEDSLLDDLLNDQSSTGATVGRTALENLTTVLMWAVSHDVVSRTEVRLLVQIELADDPGAARQEAADELELSRDSLNRRVHRIRTKLMKAVSGDIRSSVRICPRRK